jgi:DNA-binding MarR family transcriptional regulator
LIGCLLNASAAPRVHCTCGSLRRASRRLSQFYDAALAPVGIKLTQYSLLTELAKRDLDGPVSLCVLADAMVMDRSTVGHNLRPMERDALVTLTVARDDKRKRYVTLTATGRALLERARVLWRRAEDRVDAVFGDEHVAELRAALLNIAYSQDLDGEPPR